MDLLQHKKGRAFLVFSLYVSEGAPIGFIWWALPTILRNKAIDVELIASVTALLVLPWVFKFIWAPLVDSFRSSRHGFKTWIFCSQFVMGLSLVPLMFIDPVLHLPWWIACLLLHSLAAATQDVSIDAMVINAVPPKERGLLNGYMNAGMLTGRSIFGGGALLLLHSLGLGWVMVSLVSCIFLTMLLLIFVKEPAVLALKTGTVKGILQQVATGFSNKNTWFVIFFALTSGAAFESAGGLAGPFLTDQHVSKEQVGFFFLLPVVLATLIGGLIGGWLSDHRNRKRSVSLFLCGFVLFVFIIAILQISGFGSNAFSYLMAFAGMYFFVGTFTASSYALFMDQSDPRIAATQFSTYMAATNACEAWVVWGAGKLTGALDYSGAFLVMAGVSLCSLFLLRIISEKK